LTVAPWKLPLIVAAIVVPIVAAIYAGGPGVGVGVGAFVAVAIVVVAVRDRPRGAIGFPTAEGGRRVLIVVSRPVEDPLTIGKIVATVGPGVDDGDVIVLAPARIGFLDRWASDLEAARGEAQRNLVITVASLAKAGVAAQARVGDEDLVQAVEDALRNFPATDVVLVTAGEDEDPGAAEAAGELKSRLRARFQLLAVSDPAAR
jgi:hypothetical protein